jgi:hypothetical protein
VDFIDFLNKRSRKLGMLEWKMAQGAVVCITIIGVKLFPSILRIDWWILASAAALLYMRPLYLFYLDSSK